MLYERLVRRSGKRRCIAMLIASNPPITARSRMSRCGLLGCTSPPGLPTGRTDNLLPVKRRRQWSRQTVGSAPEEPHLPPGGSGAASPASWPDPRSPCGARPRHSLPKLSSVLPKQGLPPLLPNRGFAANGCASLAALSVHRADSQGTSPGWFSNAAADSAATSIG